MSTGQTHCQAALKTSDNMFSQCPANDMSADWLSSRGPSAGLEPNNFLQPRKTGQRPTTPDAGPFLTDSSAPSWLFGNGPNSTEFGFVPAYAELADARSDYPHSALLPAQSQTPQHFIQEWHDEVLQESRSASGSGSTACPSKPASSGKRSEAWNAKNRRAQKKFREKQKVSLNLMQAVTLYAASMLHTAAAAISVLSAGGKDQHAAAPR